MHLDKDHLSQTTSMCVFSLLTGWLWRHSTNVSGKTHLVVVCGKCSWCRQSLVNCQAVIGWWLETDLCYTRVCVCVCVMCVCMWYSVLQTSTFSVTSTSRWQASSCCVSVTVSVMSGRSAKLSRNTAWWHVTGDSLCCRHEMTSSSMTSLWRHWWRHLDFMSWMSRACSLTSLWMKQHRLSCCHMLHELTTETSLSVSSAINSLTNIENTCHCYLFTVSTLFWFLPHMAAFSSC